MLETRVQSLSWEDPLEKEMANHSSILAWKNPWTEEPGRLQSMGSQRVGHNWATSLHGIRLREYMWEWVLEVLAQSEVYNFRPGWVFWDRFCYQILDCADWAAESISNSFLSWFITIWIQQYQTQWNRPEISWYAIEEKKIKHRQLGYMNGFFMYNLFSILITVFLCEGQEEDTPFAITLRNTMGT